LNEVAGTGRTYRFGVFLFDAGRLELSRDGRPIRLQPQPAQVLATLLASAGRLVTRDELRRAVWANDTFVDFDRGLNFCVAQIRTTLGDDAAVPRYVRTLPKKGYEFIYPVEIVGAPPAVQSAEPVSTEVRPASARSRALALAAVAAGVFIAVGAYVAFRGTQTPSTLPIVAVARFDNETGDAALTRFGDTVTDTVVAQLTSASGGRYEVVGNAAILRGPRAQRDLRAIASSLGAAYVVLGQVQRDDQRLRVLAHLIRMPEQTHITVSRTDGIAEETLAVADDVATRIAAAFGPPLREASETASSRTPSTH
jgi:DNA-binding winged helix-turn-helix (wHTH) protein/TolB-like protein